MDRDQQEQVAMHRWAVIAEAANGRLTPAERGIAVSYETIRQWCRKFGEPFADGVRRRRPRCRRGRRRG